MILSRRIVLSLLSALAFVPATFAQQASHAAAIIDSMPLATPIQEVAISPDGARVAYTSHGHLTVVTLESNSAQTIDVEGKLELRSPTWSPDSRQLAFLADLAGEAPSAQLWTASTDGGTRVKRADLKGNADAPTFSPDGSKIALLFIEGMPRQAGPLQPMTPLTGVVGEKVYEQRLATIDLSSNTLTQITPADIYIYEYDWTPDGQAWVATA